MNANQVCKLFEEGQFSALNEMLVCGQLSRVSWSWVCKKLKLPAETVYSSIAGTKPMCSTCGKNPVSSFISFSAGYNKYCSKSCAKKDPIVEQKKQSTLSANPNWKELAFKKQRDTNLARYGGAPLTSSAILEKRQKTNIARYGTPEVLQRESLIRTRLTQDVAVNKVFGRIEQFQKIVPLFSREQFVSADDYYQWKCVQCGSSFQATLNDGNIPRCFRCEPRTSSAGERELLNFIASETNTEIKHRYKLDGKEIDIFLPDKKLGFEFNGIYWHSELRGTPKQYHLEKLQFCEERGIRLLQFWDEQWNRKPDIIKSIVRATLGNTAKINARSCSIIELSEKEAANFLQRTHLAGSARGSSLRLGLAFKNELVQVMTLGKPRFSREPNSLEILRLSAGLNAHVVGGASKLLNAAISKLNSVNTIISFCDKMCFTGRVYSSMGFNQISAGSPSCWYFGIGGGLTHRSSFQKKKLLALLDLQDSDLTEWELAQQLKLNRVWDCGSSKWKLDVVS